MFNISNALTLNLSSSIYTNLNLSGFIGHTYDTYYDYFVNCSIRPVINYPYNNGYYIYGA